MSSSLRHLGIIGIKDIPGFRAARQNALNAWSACTKAERAQPSLRVITLADGSIRRSVATTTIQHKLQRMPVIPSCSILEVGSETSLYNLALVYVWVIRIRAGLL